MRRLSPVRYRVLVCVFKLEGFICVREEGDHMIFTKRGVLRPIVIPKYTNVPVFIIKNNMRSSGMTRSDTSNFWPDAGKLFPKPPNRLA